MRDAQVRFGGGAVAGVRGGVRGRRRAHERGCSTEDSLALLECQLQKASADLGRQEAEERYTDELMNSAEEDGDTLQVILDGDGYSCPEYMS